MKRSEQVVIESVVSHFSRLTRGCQSLLPRGVGPYKWRGRGRTVRKTMKGEEEGGWDSASCKIKHRESMFPLSHFISSCDICNQSLIISSLVGWIHSSSIWSISISRLRAIQYPHMPHDPSREYPSPDCQWKYGSLPTTITCYYYSSWRTCLNPGSRCHYSSHHPLPWHWQLFVCLFPLQR